MKISTAAFQNYIKFTSGSSKIYLPKLIDLFG